MYVKEHPYFGCGPDVQMPVAPIQEQPIAFFGWVIQYGRNKRMCREFLPSGHLRRMKFTVVNTKRECSEADVERYETTAPTVAQRLFYHRRRRDGNLHHRPLLGHAEVLK